MNLSKNDIVTLEITGMTSEGNGVGRIDGFAVFVPMTAVGDIVRVKIVKLLKNYGFGRTIQIITHSVDRIENDCAVFGKCGGCAYRHITYQSELSLKQDMVFNNMNRIGEVSFDPLPIVAGSQPQQYRNKAQYPVSTDQDGNIIIGFYAQRSHRVIDCMDCKLQPPIFTEILKKVHTFLTENKISVYNEQTHIGLIRHIYLRQATTTGQVMLCVVINGNTLPRSEKLIETLTTEFPEIKSIVLNINKQKTNVILSSHCLTIWGKDTITDVLCGLTFHISPLSFYQVNHDGAQKLYTIAGELANLTGTEILLDLYCGAGTIGLSLAHKVGKVIGIEIIPDAIENAKQNAKINQITNAVFICDDASGAETYLKSEGIVPDVAILDPPRKGCDSQVLDIIARLGIPRIVMVSCNSATLARDVKYLSQLGYSAGKLAMVDMFPRTTHVECVIGLYRVDS